MCSDKRFTPVYEILVNRWLKTYYKREKVFHLVFHSIQDILPRQKASVFPYLEALFSSFRGSVFARQSFCFDKTQPLFLQSNNSLYIRSQK